MSFKKKSKRSYREPPRLASITIRVSYWYKEAIRDLAIQRKSSMSVIIRKKLEH